jgi:hypothetical protein
MNNENIENNNKKEEVISINVLMKYIKEVKDCNHQGKKDKWSGLYQKYIQKYYNRSAYKKALDRYNNKYISDAYSYNDSMQDYYIINESSKNHQYALCLYYAIQNGEVEQSIIDEIREFAIAGL